MTEREVARMTNLAWALNTKKDFCKVGKDIIPFDIVCDLSKAATCSPNVTANSRPVLAVTHKIPGMVGNAGSGLSSGVSQLAGYVLLNKGSSTVTYNNLAAVRHLDDCLMNCDAAGKSNVPGKIYTSAVEAKKYRDNENAATAVEAIQARAEPDLVLKDIYSSQRPGGYSTKIADMQARLIAADRAGALDQPTKLQFLDEVTAELMIAQERRRQLPNVFTPNMSAADISAHQTLDADMALLLDDRRRLDEQYFNETPIGKIKTIVELAFLAKAITKLPQHIQDIARWIRKKPSTPKPASPVDGAVVRAPKVRDPKREQELSKDPAHNGKISEKSKREADVGLSLEERGDLKGPIKRDPNPAGGEFIDADGRVWDVKGFNSKFENGFNLETAVDKIAKEVGKGEGVIIDTAKMSAEHINQLRNALKPLNMGDLIKWFP